MATKQEIITTARNYLRDHPRFLQETYNSVSRTVDLGKPNIDSTTLWVRVLSSDGSTSTPTFSLDERNGLLRLSTELLPTDTLMVEAYYYEWLLPSDMDFYADMAINLNTHNLKTPLENLAPAVADVVGIHTLIQALWGLMSEYSRDIDVITSESVHVMASQRYRMVSSLLQYWTDEYNKRAHALNIGLERLEVVNLRRVSRTNNRLVPLYKPREVGDYGPIERIFPDIDEGVISVEDDEDDELRQDVYVEGEPPPGYLSTGHY